MSARKAAAVAALLTTACGGGSPLFHGAHALGPGATAQGAGFSGTFAFGNARSAAKSVDVGDRAAAIDVLAPAVAPWVSGRVGFGGDNEAGLTYTGRTFRVDARHAFENDDVALSVGAGVSAVLRSESDVLPHAVPARTAPSGFGFDVPLLLGWRSAAGIVTLWGGARAGLEKLSANSSTPDALDMSRFYAGAVLGLALGFRHVHGAIELDSYYQRVAGSFGNQDVRLTGVTLTPGGGLILTF